MLKGIEAAASGMISMMELNDVIANNLANVNTPGFKQFMTSFINQKELNVNEIDAKQGYMKNILGTVSAGSNLYSTMIDFQQGVLKQTGNPFDFALKGEGFFAVRGPNNEELYTRNGTFIKNTDGQIVTKEGYPLLGEKGPITLNIEGKDFKNLVVGTDGNIKINGEIVDKIKIVDFENKGVMQSLGNSLYKPVNNAINPRVPVKNVEVEQKSIELSNANVVDCMIKSINGSRAYETMSTVIKTTDRTLQQAVNQLGRIR